MKSYVFPAFLFFLLSPLFFSCTNQEGQFQKAKKINTVESYKKYISDYPEGIFRKEAQDSIYSLAFQSAKKINTLQSYKKYIAEYAEGNYLKEVQDSIYSLAFQSISVPGTLQEFELYLKEYPDSYKTLDVKYKIYHLLLKSDWLCKFPDSVMSVYQRCDLKNTSLRDSISKIVWDCIKATSITNYPSFIKTFDSTIYSKKAQKYIEGIEWDEIDKNTVIIKKGWDINNRLGWWVNWGEKEHWDSHIPGYRLNGKPFIIISRSSDSYIEYLSATKAKIFKMNIIPKEFRPEGLPTNISIKNL